MGKSSMICAIGLMSGTSMDGIDVASISTDGENRVERHGFASFPYDDAFRNQLRQALVDATSLTDRAERPGCLGSVEHELTKRHAEAVARFLSDRNISARDIDLVAFHGQTVLHRPDQSLTLQLGDGAQLAEWTGLNVVYDLRAADVAAGGQGAPLAPVYHRAIVAGLARPAGGGTVAVLNVGGVANVTFVSESGHLTAFDTGPGNALIDDWVLRHTGMLLDENGALAGAGEADPTALDALLDNAYFVSPPPKSLDRNHFNAMPLQSLSLEDGAATLTAFTAEAVALAARHAGAAPKLWVVCGGGRRNLVLMRALRERLAGDVISAEDAGFDGDAVEAEAWGYLGVRSLNGTPITFPGTTGVGIEMTGGRLARV